MEVKVFGERRSEVTVRAADVIQGVIDSIVPTNSYLWKGDGKYLIIDAGGPHSPECVNGEVSHYDYKLVNHLKKAIVYLHKKQDEEIHLKREFEEYKKNKLSD